MAEQAGIDIELRLTDRAVRLILTLRFQFFGRNRPMLTSIVRSILDRRRETSSSPISEIHSRLCVSHLRSPYLAQLELSSYGFSHKILTCARAYLKYIDTYEVSEARFEYLMEDFRRNCKNQNLSPESHANYLRMHILRADLNSTNPQRLEFANSEECTSANLQRWISENVVGKTAEGSGEREAAHAAAFMIGNVSQEETAAFGAEAAATFGVAATTPGGWRPEDRIVKLKRLTLIQAEAQNKEEESSAIGALFQPQFGTVSTHSATFFDPSSVQSGAEYYFQLMPDTLPDGSPALTDTAKLDLMSRLIAEPAFDVLRTKEQLGYSVNAGVRRTCAHTRNPLLLRF
jgi:nardilysin